MNYNTSWGRRLGTLLHSAPFRLVERLLIVLLVYTLLRIIFYILNIGPLHIAGSATLLNIFRGGLKFDLSALFYVNSLFILLSILPFRFRASHKYQKALLWIFAITNTMAVTLNMADTGYFRFSLSRTTMAVFSEFSNENKFSYVRMLWDYWHLTLITIVLVWSMIWLYKRTLSVREDYWRKRPWLYYGAGSVWFVLVCVAAVGGIRGGLAHSDRPITMTDAGQYIDEPQQRAMVLNTPFCFIRTAGKPTLQPLHIYTPEEAEAIYPAVKDFPAPNAEMYGEYMGKNVMIIIWESFAAEWSGLLNADVPGYRGYTPFADSLAQQGLLFDHAYANGRKSIDAMPSILTSLPRVGAPFFVSHYAGNKLNSIASLLKPMGYTSAFFHGANNGSMGFESFTHQVGYDLYYGGTQYANSKDHDGTWGIWDHKFLPYTVQQLDTLKQPFLGTLFTLSSHHPFKIPQGYKHKYPKGKMPIMECIGYTDDALRNFFALAQTKPWYKNTLFVIVADHAVGGVLPQYETPAGVYRIPLIFFDPEGKLKGRHAQTAQQTDIMPTLLNLLGYKGKFVAFGQDLLNPSVPQVALMNNEDAFQLVQQDTLVITSSGGDKVALMYDLKQDKMQKNNLLEQNNPNIKRKAQQMERIINAFRQTYTDRTLANRMAEP